MYAWNDVASGKTIGEISRSKNLYKISGTTITTATSSDANFAINTFVCNVTQSYVDVLFSYWISYPNGTAGDTSLIKRNLTTLKNGNDTISIQCISGDDTVYNMQLATKGYTPLTEPAQTRYLQFGGNPGAVYRCQI